MWTISYVAYTGNGHYDQLTTSVSVDGRTHDQMVAVAGMIMDGLTRAGFRVNGFCK